MTRDAGVDFAGIARQLRASTVRVHDARGRGSGSGVVWRGDEGLIITNAHVVRANAATVEFETGRTERAELTRRDDGRDLAALQIAGTSNAAAAVRDARELRPGELVVAVGNPLGLVGALTVGLVQRSNARWVVADVRLAPGNSGGPLADAGGRIVGINSMVVGSLGYAVPSEAVTAFLGAQRRIGVALTPAIARVDGGTVPAFVVTEIEAGSVAERSGILFGDVILGTDAGPLGRETIAALLAEASELTIVRAGIRRDVTLRRSEGARAA